MNEIESRLKAKGLLLPTVPRVNIPKRLNSSGSEGRSTTTSPASESSGGSGGGSPGGGGGGGTSIKKIGCYEW